MDFDKVYHDVDGDECTIIQMVLREPEWAANRIQEGEKAQAKVEKFGMWIKTNLNNTFQLTEEELEESLENILAEDK